MAFQLPAILVVLVAFPTVFAQTPEPKERDEVSNDAQHPPPDREPAAAPDKISLTQTDDFPESGTTLPPAEGEAGPQLVEPVDYSGDLWTRPALTGDWGGLRSELSQKGLKFNFRLTQVLQRNLRGGSNFSTTYSGRADFGFLLDTEQMGLWPGGLIKVNAQTRYGDDNNFNTGALFPVNLISLYPDAVEECYTALSDWYITQFFSPRLAVLVGKVSFRESNVFAHNETDQFLSMPLNFNPLPGITLPTMSTLMAGVIVRPTDWLMISTFVADPEGRAGVVGFDTAFDRGTTLMQTAEVAIKPFGLPGHQRVGWTWTDQSLVQLQQDPRLILSNIQRGLEPPVRTADSDWSFLYDFDQFLYTVPGHPDRGLGVFGRFGLSDGKVNMMRAFYSVGIGGKGLIPGRERDSFGVGYYYLDLSSDMPQVLRDQTHDEQGVELYYRISVTPWLHITPDVQIINPAARDIGTTWVAGVRMTIDL